MRIFALELNNDIKGIEERKEYVNSIGKLEYMPGMMGRLMKMSKFQMNGMSKIYANDLSEISSDMPEVVAAEVEVSPKQRAKDIRFYGNDILNSNWIFRKMILEPEPGWVSVDMRKE